MLSLDVGSSKEELTSVRLLHSHAATLRRDLLVPCSLASSGLFSGRNKECVCAWGMFAQASAPWLMLFLWFGMFPPIHFLGKLLFFCPVVTQTPVLLVFPSRFALFSYWSYFS